MKNYLVEYLTYSYGFVTTLMEADSCDEALLKVFDREYLKNWEGKRSEADFRVIFGWLCESSAVEIIGTPTKLSLDGKSLIESKRSEYKTQVIVPKELTELERLKEKYRNKK